MFTGIIEETGRIERTEPLGGGRKLFIASSFAEELRVDQSVAINGVCQTVVAVEDACFGVVAVEETLAKTTMGLLEVGTPVNLERAMIATSRFDGHVVQGHVDTTATIVDARALETSTLFTFGGYPPEMGRWIVPTGSITVDGISLTVARLHEDSFTVAIIPHTWEVTNVSTWAPRGRVNLEFDVIGKYVDRLVSLQPAG